MFQDWDTQHVSMVSLQQMENGTYIAPMQSPMIVDRAVNPERHALEPPEVEHNRGCARSEHDPLGALCETTRSQEKVVDKMCSHEDSKVECREL